MYNYSSIQAKYIDQTKFSEDIEKLANSTRYLAVLKDGSITEISFITKIYSLILGWLGFFEDNTSAQKIDKALKDICSENKNFIKEPVFKNILNIAIHAKVITPPKNAFEEAHNLQGVADNVCNVANILNQIHKEVFDEEASDEWPSSKKIITIPPDSHSNPTKPHKIEGESNEIHKDSNLTNITLQAEISKIKEVNNLPIEVLQKEIPEIGRENQESKKAEKLSSNKMEENQPFVETYEKKPIQIAISTNEPLPPLQSLSSSDEMEHEDPPGTKTLIDLSTKETLAPPPPSLSSSEEIEKKHKHLTKTSFKFKHSKKSTEGWGSTIKTIMQLATLAVFAGLAARYFSIDQEANFAVGSRRLIPDSSNSTGDSFNLLPDSSPLLPDPFNSTADASHLLPDPSTYWNQYPHTIIPLNSTSNLTFHPLKEQDKIISKFFTDREAESFTLSSALLEAAKPYIDDASKCPKAPSGNDACLPEGIPVVIKRRRGEELINKMDQARQLCKNGGYIHLDIAKASFYKNSIIQTYLPVTSDYKLNVGLYLENLVLFSDAAKEFTGFLCQARLTDIDSSKASLSYKHLSSGPIPRFDQVGLYLEKSDNGMRGKVALIDLDEFQLEPQDTDLSHQVGTAVLFFPHHYEAILTEAEKFYPDIHHQSKELEEIRDRGMEFYHNVYGDHSEFLRNKGITVSQPRLFPEVSDGLKINIQQKVFDKFVQHINESEKISISSESLEEFKRDIIPEFFDLVLQLIVDGLNNKPLLSIETNAQLVSFRTLNFFHAPIQVYQNSKWKAKITSDFVVERLVNIIFQEMVSHKILANAFKWSSSDLVIFC